MIFQGDARVVLQQFEDGVFDCTITSPPYFGLRNYGVEGQFGLESAPDQYVESMLALSTEVHRTVRDDGTFWLNIGDSYAGSGKGRWNKHETHDTATRERYKPTYGSGLSAVVPNGLKPKDMMGIPWRMAFALQGFAVVPHQQFSVWADQLRMARENEDWEAVRIVEQVLRSRDLAASLQAAGWYLRNDIIWAKPNPMPSSATDRFTTSHEHVFLLAKSADYYFDQEAVMEDAVSAGRPRGGKNAFRGQGAHEGVVGAALRDGRDMKTIGFTKQDAAGLRQYKGFNARYTHKPRRNKRDVWTVAPRGFKGAHFATFPPALIEPMVKAGSRPGGTVLDPFFGSGTTGVVASRLGRNFVGIELNEEYIQLATRRLDQEVGVGAW